MFRGKESGVREVRVRELEGLLPGLQHFGFGCLERQCIHPHEF